MPVEWKHPSDLESNLNILAVIAEYLDTANSEENWYDVTTLS